MNAQTGAVTGNVPQFFLYRFGTHSAGTALTANIRSHDTNDALDANVTARTGATIATEDTQPLKRWKWSTDEYGSGAADVESADHALQNLLPHYDSKVNSGMKAITLRAGQGLHIRVDSAGTVGTYDVFFEFTQAAS
jgi:hypothetical protein